MKPIRPAKRDILKEAVVVTELRNFGTEISNFSKMKTNVPQTFTLYPQLKDKFKESQ